MTHTEIVNFIWGVADLIRDTFKRGKYQDVILPLTVLRRLDCVLAAAGTRVFIEQLEQKLAGGPALAASVRVDTPENARLTFDHVVTGRLQEMVDTNFKFYKRVTDDREFARFFVDWLFERFRKSLTAG